MSLSTIVLWLAAVRPLLVLDIVAAHPQAAYRFYASRPTLVYKVCLIFSFYL